jgi:DNA helicase-2/ATP-dependent DNA helicase PcrA
MMKAGLPMPETNIPENENPAEQASREALEAVFQALDNGQSFRLEAGAGAGKTYSLVKALRYLMQKHGRDMPRSGQQVACITFTNVAKDEILTRTDKDPIIFCDTNHAFCWLLISGFQKQLRAFVADLEPWQERLAEVGGIGERVVTYSLGFRSVRDAKITLHHDDVIPLTVKLMESVKFRRLMVDRFPIILIDEYQDTDERWINAIKEHFLGRPGSPLFGFFGDHWQKIYGDGCGLIEHEAIVAIGKEANFRSVASIVSCLNRMRPALPQFPEDPNSVGQIKVFHTNDWVGQRQVGAHWSGDLPSAIGHQALELVKESLQNDGWIFEHDKTKILMLTHRLLAEEQGYASLPGVFRFNEAFAKKEHPHIAYFVDVLEPACDAYVKKRFGAMFEALGSSVPQLKNHADKVAWVTAMDQLLPLRAEGTVGQVLDLLRQMRRPRLPDAVADRDEELRNYVAVDGEEMPRVLSELQAFREVSYAEVMALRTYLAGYSPFETKHGVKGAQFENVLVVLGRGWNHYNFKEMLELSGAAAIAANKQKMFERNRNLFYVAISRPKQRLCLLFTQDLSAGALTTLRNWFGHQSIEALVF